MSKTIAIIGASRGIGLACAMRFAKDENNKILVFARNVERMEKEFASFRNVEYFHLDLEDQILRDKISQKLASRRIDFLINNAGLLINKAFPELTHEDLTRSYQVNTIAVMECVQAVLEHSKPRHIVNISSMGGFQGSMKFPGLAAYSTSKAAICSFTELFAEEYKDSGISMNCLCLGAVQTEMLEEAFPGYEAPMGPEEMAEFICDFTLNAYRWMNGKVIPVSLSTP